MHSRLNHANHKWSIWGDYSPPMLLCLCWHGPNIWIPPDLSQVYSCPLYQNIHLSCFERQSKATTPFESLNCPRVGATCRPLHLLNLLFFILLLRFPAGSNSGYQADPSQLPEDVVHPGRDCRVPHWIHTVVCGNNEQCCCSSSGRLCCVVRRL